MGDTSREFIYEIIDALDEVGNLNALDKMAFYMLAGNIEMYLNCEQKVIEEGLTVESAQGNVNLSPYVTQMKYLWGQISDMLKQMGLTLASRTRLKLPDGSEEASPLMQLMNGDN